MVASPYDAGREHVRYEVRLGLSASVRRISPALTCVQAVSRFCILRWVSAAIAVVADVRDFCVGGDDDEDGWAVDVWQDLFRVDSRVWNVERIRGCADS